MANAPPWVIEGKPASLNASEDRRYDDIFSHWVDEDVYLGDSIPNHKPKKHTPRILKPPPKASIAETLGHKPDFSKNGAQTWLKRRPTNPAGNAGGGRKASGDKDSASKPQRYWADRPSARPTETPKSLAQAAPSKAGPANPLGEFIPFERSPSPGEILESIYVKSQPLSGYVPKKSASVQATEPEEIRLPPSEPVLETSDPGSGPQPFQWIEAAYSGHDQVASRSPSPATGAEFIAFKEDTSPEEPEEGAIAEMPSPSRTGDGLAGNSLTSQSTTQAANFLYSKADKMASPGQGVSVVDGTVFIDIVSDHEGGDSPVMTGWVSSPVATEAAPHKAEITSAQETETESESDAGDSSAGAIMKARMKRSRVDVPEGRSRSNRDLVRAGMPLNREVHEEPPNSPSQTADSTIMQDGDGDGDVDMPVPPATDPNTPEDDEARRRVATGMFDEEEVRKCGLYLRANSECQLILARIIQGIADYEKLRQIMHRVKAELPEGLLPASLSVSSQVNDPKIDNVLGYLKFLSRGATELKQSRAPAPLHKLKKEPPAPAKPKVNSSARKSTIPAPGKISLKSKTRKKNKQAKRKIAKLALKQGEPAD